LQTQNFGPGLETTLDSPSDAWRNDEQALGRGAAIEEGSVETSAMTMQSQAAPGVEHL
jgi:hypothetical protein